MVAHSCLLVEPVVLPEMTHLSVDESLAVSENCIFYPTGKKNVNMRRTMEETVRKVNAQVCLCLCLCLRLSFKSGSSVFFSLLLVYYFLFHVEWCIRLTAVAFFNQIV